MRAGHLIKGRDAESRARRYLEQRGLACIEANYRCPPGEIDLIMRQDEGQDEVIVFVEVRFRKDHRYGGALESIDHRKQQRLRAAAEHYLQRRHGTAEVACRFDVVLITGAPGGGAGSVDWIQDAL